MNNDASKKRILGAFVAGSAVVLLAIIFSDPSQAPATDNVNAITVVEAPQRTAVAVADSNQDGVPDWQEALQTTDSISLDASTTEYQPPETLTDQFAVQFFEQMMRAESNAAFGANPEELVDASSNALLKQAVDKPITAADIIISQDNSPTALAAYGETVAKIIKQYEETSGLNEAGILDRAIQTQSEAELHILDNKVAAYQNFLIHTKALPVPSSLQTYHLALLNVYQALAHDIEAMRNAFADPMMALIRLKRYQQDADALLLTITSLYTDLSDRGATWPPTSPVYLLVSFE